MVKFILIPLFMLATFISSFEAQSQITKFPQTTADFGADGDVTAFDVSKDGRYLIVGLFRLSDREANIEAKITAVVYDLNSMTVVREFLEHKSSMSVVAISDNNQYVFTGDIGGGVMWLLEDGKFLYRIQTPPHLPREQLSEIRVAKFVKNDTTLLTVDFRGYIQLWDTKTGDEIFRYSEIMSAEDIKLFRDGNRFMLRDENGARIGYINERNFDSTLYFNGPAAEIHENEQWIMTLSNGAVPRTATVSFWDARTGALVSKSDASFPFFTRDDHITKDGRYVLLPAHDTEPATIIEVNSGRELQRFSSEGNLLLKNSRFSSDSKRVIGALENKVFIYDITDLLSSIPQAKIHQN